MNQLFVVPLGDGRLLSTPRDKVYSSSTPAPTPPPVGVLLVCFLVLLCCPDSPLPPVLSIVCFFPLFHDLLVVLIVLVLLLILSCAFLPIYFIFYFCSSSCSWSARFCFSYSCSSYSSSYFLLQLLLLLVLPNPASP